MNKTKMILAATGGVIGLAVLVMAYFVWQAFSDRTAAIEGDDEEGTDGLETVVAKAQTLSRKPVYPCAESLAAIESNRAAVAAWQAEARKAASAGDRVFKPTTPAAFKTFIVSDAKRLAALPGAANGVLVKPDFTFGPFKEYIAEGKMPADAKLAELQRQWDDVVTVIEKLAESGIAELVDIGFAESRKDEPETKKATKAKKAKPARKAAKPAASGAQSAALNPLSYTYVFTFAARPTAFAKAINALATGERFITVDGFTFSRPKDPIAEALGGEEKKEAAATASRRGRRGRRGAAEAAPSPAETDGAAAQKGGIVTDPLLDPPLSVVMTVTVTDFRSLEEDKHEEGK